MPTACQVYQCSHNDSFRTFQDLRAHVVTKHTAPLRAAYQVNKGQPILQCLYPGCHEKAATNKVTTAGEDQDKYRQHLQKAHDLCSCTPKIPTDENEIRNPYP